MKQYSLKNAIQSALETLCILPGSVLTIFDRGKILEKKCCMCNFILKSVLEVNQE